MFTDFGELQAQILNQSFLRIEFAMKFNQFIEKFVVFNFLRVK